MSLTKTKIALPRCSRLSGWPHTKEQTCRLAEEICRRSMNIVFQSHPLFGRRLRGLPGVLFFPTVGCKKHFIHQRTATAEPGDPPLYRCGRYIPHRRCLHQTDHHVPHRRRGRLVCLQGVSQRAVCSSYAATFIATFYFTGTFSVNIT